jgi:hypothetical protein
MLKSFEKWTHEELGLEFGYERIASKFGLLDQWLNEAKRIEIQAKDMIIMEALREDLEVDVVSHNEEELKVHFITPILNLVKLGKRNVYKLFAQRNISAQVTNKKGITDKLGGRVEVMVAMGTQNPRHPYFFVHEYKPLNKNTPSDPLGQLVAAMIVAQVTNADDKPIYGLYVMGGSWRFVVLDGKKFGESKPYEATDEDDLKLIVQALFWIKNHIEMRIETEGIE